MPQPGFESSHPMDNTPFSRKWLMEQSKEELVDLVLSLKGKVPKSTDQLIGELVSASFNTNQLVQEWVRLPVAPRRDPIDVDDVTWRVVLYCADNAQQPIGLDICDDIIIGRSMPGITPDLDLEGFDGERLGVSRQHAMLRPTTSGLYLVDLGSTNGTFSNAMQLSPGVIGKVKDKDTISFGSLHFMVRIIEHPAGEQDPDW
jgi:hypothetical protein